MIYIIIAAVTCAGIMQASGGMDWLIQIAEKMLRKHPDRITFLASADHVLPHGTGGNGTCGVYADAYYL